MTKPAKPAKKPAKSGAKAPAKPAAKKPAAVKTTPKAPSKAAKTPEKSKVPAAKTAAPAKAPAKAPAPVAKGAHPAKPGAKVDDKSKKGAPAPAPAKPAPAAKKVKPPSAPIPLPPGVGRLMDTKFVRKPLISSGPKAAHTRPLGQHGGYAPEVALPQAKTPFTPEELDGFRQLLLKKRTELIADVKGMEDQALQGQSSGSLSNMPSHLAEQGSEAYDQALSLDLAAADRRIIKEIDAALKRIADGTFGICEHTGKPIKLERLKELPWARYSIEAAREIERQAMRG